MSVLYVDVVGGAAGDMLLAALLDAGASRDEVSDAVSAVLGRRVECVTEEVRRRGLRALALSGPGDLPSERRRPRELLDAVERAALGDEVRARATSVLRRLFDAEAKVHGREIADLELEELGEDDTLLDVVGVAAALDSLGVERVDVSAIPMPPPSNDGMHGSPAPVTLELLSGFALRPSLAGAEEHSPRPRVPVPALRPAGAPQSRRHAAAHHLPTLPLPDVRLPASVRGHAGGQG